MCVMLCGSQRSASRFYRTCCCSNWCNSLSLPTALSLTTCCSDLCSLPSSLPRETLGSSPACARSLPWMTGREEQQPGQALVPLPDSCNCNEGVYAAFLTLAEGICFISALFDMQSGLVRCQSVKLYYSSVGRFFFFSLISSTRLEVTFFHPLWLSDSKIYQPLTLFLKKILTLSHTETHTQTYSQTE